MNVLLDTHAFLWFIGDDPRLTVSARETIESPDVTPFLSAASLWEMSIKISLGKLTLPKPYEVFLREQLTLNGVGILNITLRHTAAVIDLPFHHRDPFDRLLAAQAMTEDLTLISADAVFDRYPVKRLW